MINQASNPRTSIRLTGYGLQIKGRRKLATARSHKGAAARLRKDAEFWQDMGWRDFEIEDYTPGLGWTPVLVEDLRGKLKRQEIDADTFNDLVGLAS